MLTKAAYEAVHDVWQTPCRGVNPKNFTTFNVINATCEILVTYNGDIDYCATQGTQTLYYDLQGRCNSK